MSFKKIDQQSTDASEMNNDENDSFLFISDVFNFLQVKQKFNMVTISEV